MNVLSINDVVADDVSVDVGNDTFIVVDVDRPVVFVVDFVLPYRYKKQKQLLMKYVIRELKYT